MEFFANFIVSLTSAAAAAAVREEWKSDWRQRWDSLAYTVVTNLGGVIEYPDSCFDAFTGRRLRC